MTDTTDEAWRDIVADNLRDPDAQTAVRWPVSRVDDHDDIVGYHTAAVLPTDPASSARPTTEPADHPGFAAGSVAVYASGTGEYRVYPPHTGPAPDDDGSHYEAVELVMFHTFPAPPMFNALWPLRSAGRWEPDELWNLARALAPFPLALVEDEDLDITGLVPTGAGSDLRWQIAAAFVALGFLPPSGLRLEADSRDYAVAEIGEARTDAVILAYAHGLDIRVRRARVAADRARAMLPGGPTP